MSATKIELTREYLDSRLSRLERELVVWIVGAVGLSTFINHWWR